MGIGGSTNQPTKHHHGVHSTNGGHNKYSTHNGHGSHDEDSKHVPTHKHVKKPLNQVIKEIKEAGVEGSNLIIVVDFTESNFDQGKITNGGQNLHQLHINKLNQYQLVISALASTLVKFDEDGQIPMYGFGDMRTKNHSVFPMHDENIGYVLGVEGALAAYCSTVGLFERGILKMSGPTSLVPVIDKAIDIVREECGYHILIVIGDGMVIDEEESENAIVRASNYSLSIIFIGVGDGPWDKMEHFDSCLPKRDFDNFKFVRFSKYIDMLRGKLDSEFLDEDFSADALGEIADQYKAIRSLRLLKRRVHKPVQTMEQQLYLPPPTAPSYPTILPSAPPS
jgi:E3 ubiquitin-protein ligase RGLG